VSRAEPAQGEQSIVRALSSREASGWLPPVQGAPDWFSLGTQASDAPWQDERSHRIARRMRVVLAEESPIIVRYLAALSYAPHEHLARLKLRGTGIVLAPTIPDALRSPWAASRRGFPLSDEEVEEAQRRYGPGARVLAAFDPRLDALILPTAYCGRDLVWCVLHELGHALTMDLAWRAAPSRQDLLLGLPREVARHLRDGDYDDPDGETAVRLRVSGSAGGRLRQAGVSAAPGASRRGYVRADVDPWRE
jgi:hypothetical protein